MPPIDFSGGRFGDTIFASRLISSGVDGMSIGCILCLEAGPDLGAGIGFDDSYLLELVFVKMEEVSVILSFTDVTTLSLCSFVDFNTSLCISDDSDLMTVSCFVEDSFSSFS